MTAVVGTHTHVHTADERIVNGTAAISDLGMCGAYTSVLGRDVDEIVTRAGRDIKGVLANVGPFMRLVDHDLEDMWPADENDRSRDQDEVNGLFDQILTVASECA